MHTRHVPIESPCHESWEAMEGDAERRFCGVCQKHVHDLSAMRHDDAVALLRDSAGEHLCVRYSAEADGALRFRDLVPPSRLTRGLRRAAFAAFLLAACGPTIEAPVPELAEVIIDRIAHAAEATSDGGCTLALGPFTALHLPPGHAFCGPVDEAAGIASPPSPRTIDPAPHEPDPLDRPRMGAAVATPGPRAPFVPCDPDVPPVPHVIAAPLLPEPGFAPPPPRPAHPTPASGRVTPLPNPFPGIESSPEPDSYPHPPFAPPPPNPFPDSMHLPPPSPPDPPPLMGSISPPSDTRMGRIARH